MHEIDRSLFKRVDPMSIATELNTIASRHLSCGNQVERGPFGIVKLLLPTGEACYVPSGRGIELFIYKYDAQELKEGKPNISGIRTLK